MSTTATTPSPVDDRFTSADRGLFLSVAVIWGDEVFALEVVGVAFVIGGAILASRRTASRRALP